MTILSKIVFFCFLISPIFCYAVEDSPEERSRQVFRYIEVIPPEEILSDIVANMVKNMPENERQEIIELMTVHFDTEQFTKILHHIFVKHMTAQELKALADFYSTPNAKSAMRKTGLAMADAMPLIRQEVIKAQKRMNESNSK